MYKFIDENILKRVSERNGFDPESLLQVIKRFDGLRTDLKEQAVARAIQTENWGQLDAFICFGFWSLTPALQPLPEPVAKIPDVAEAWELESLKQSKRAVSLGKEFVTNRSWNDLKHMLQRVPPELQKHPVIYSEWRSAALGRLWAVMPHGWTEFIALDPRLQKDPVVLQKRKMHWLAYFKAGSTKCYVSPKEESVQDLELYYLPGGVDAATGAPDAESLVNPEVYSAWRNAWLRVYRAYTGQPPVPPPRELRENSDVYSAWKRAWVSFCGLPCDGLPTMPPSELLENSEVYSAWRKSWVKFYRVHTWQPPVLPPSELRDNSEVHSAWRKAWLEYYRIYRSTWTPTGYSKPANPPDELLGDEVVVGAWRALER